MVGAFLAGLAGGFVGGYAGAGSRSPEVVVRKQIQTIDYKRLAEEVIKALKDERENAINNRIAEIKRLEESRKCTCAKCGKEIVCREAYITKQPESELLNVYFNFQCDCKSETVSEGYLRDSYYDDDFYIRGDAGSIVRHNAEHPLGFEFAVNKNKEAFKDVFDKAYALWETQSDLDKKNGCTPYTQELERLNAMLSDPLGLTVDTNIPTLKCKNEEE